MAVNDSISHWTKRQRKLEIETKSPRCRVVVFAWSWAEEKAVLVFLLRSVVLLGKMGGKTKNQRIYSANPSDYKLLEEVGYGATATVYRAIYLPSNEVVAVKCLDLDRCNSNLVRLLLSHSLSLSQYALVFFFFFCVEIFGFIVWFLWD